MPFSFPSSPSIGDKSTQNSREYEWSGYAWEIVATPAALSASVITSGTFDAARLPLATTGAAGAVIVGTGLGVSSGTVSVTYGTTSGTACQGNDSRLSDARTPTSHSHGNITNAGAIGSTANLPIITTTSGVLTTGSFGTSAATFCEGNDSRLSDTRTPTDGSVTTAKIANDAVTYAKIQNVSATDRLLGRSSAGAGDVEEITCTAFGRSLIDDADAAAARSTLSVQPTASPTFTGTLTAAQARVNGSDSSTILLVNGGTKGVRFNISSASSAIEGVDNGGVSSYQPLVVGGSTLTLATAGVSAIAIDGSQKATLAAQLLVTAGSASACGVAFSGDPDTGIAQLGGANTLSFVTNEAERLQINADGNAIFTRPGEYALVMRRTDTGVTNNFISAIAYDAKNASGTYHSYCRLITQQTDATAGTESGQFYLQVRNNGTERSYVLIDGESDTVKLLTGGYERVRVDASGNVLVGTSNADPIGGNVEGVVIGATYAMLSRSGALPLLLNRKSNDGDLAGFWQDGAFEGSISVAGNAVSYNAFCGSHWAQLIDGSRPAILRGTVLETIDEMCEWPDGKSDRLPRVKVSDTPRSRRVYGVFMAWDEDYASTGDMYATALGAYMVRVSGVVQSGDLLESAGDGTARTQPDDIVRSSTIGKVSSTHRVAEYDDGSYLVPCVLMCG